MGTLVYHAGALGDFITTLPAIGVWRRLHPGQRVVLLGKPSFAPLASPAFDEVWDAQGLGSSRVHLGFGSITSALLFAGEGSPLVRQLGDRGVREVLRQAPFPSSAISVVDYHLSLFGGPAVREEDRVPRIAITVAALSDAPGAIVIHAGSGSARKNWPLESFIALARALEAERRSVRWIVGPAEEGMPLPGEALQWRGVPLPRLAASIAACALYVGNDSGITHLAAACGCPTVALFDKERPAVWAPRGARVMLIASNTERMEDIALQEVVRKCRMLLEG